MNRTRTSTLDAFGLRNQRNRIYPALAAGDGSTLSLDFTSMSTLDPSLFTFTRSSTTATYINSLGYVTSATTNEPRFDYDPTTLAPRGLLIESSATNLVTRSDALDDTSNLSWLVSGMTRSSSTQVSPTGNSETVALVSGNGSFRSNNVTVTASTTYTFSFWAKNNSGTQARYRVWNATAGSSIVDYTQSSSNYISQLSNTAWTRISVTFTTPVGCTSIFVYPCSSDTTGTNVYLWGAQLEAGNSASSYVSSGTSQGQRSADSCQLTGTNFSSWFNATEGTFLARGQRRLTSNTAYLLSANDATHSEVLSLGSSTTGNWLIRDGGSNVASITPGTVTANTSYKIAGAFAVNDAQAALNGTLGTADTNLTLPTVTQLDIGRDRSTVYLDGTIESIKFWPTRLSNATLQSLTA